MEEGYDVGVQSFQDLSGSLENVGHMLAVGR